MPVCPYVEIVQLRYTTDLTYTKGKTMFCTNKHTPQSPPKSMYTCCLAQPRHIGINSAGNYCADSVENKHSEYNNNGRARTGTRQTMLHNKSLQYIIRSKRNAAMLQ